MSNPNLNLDDLADDDDPDLDDESGSAPAAPPSTARPAPSEDDDEGFTSEAEQRAAERGTALPSPEASTLSALPLDQLLKRLDDDAKPARGRPRGRKADFTLPPPQRQAHISKIADKLAAAEQAYQALQARQADVNVLDDTAPSSFASELARAEAELATLKAALAKHTAAHRQAEAEEARQAFEQSVRATIASHADKYAAGLQELHFYVAQIGALGAALDEHRQAIEGASYAAAERGRPDLGLAPETIRRAVGRLFTADDVSVVTPQRWGEADGEWHTRVFATLKAQAEGRVRKDAGTLSPRDRARVELAQRLYVEPEADEDDAVYAARQLAHLAEALPCRQADGETTDEHRDRLLALLARKLGLTRKGESDSAYTLRLANARAMTAERGGDILDETGQRAVPVIAAHAASSTSAERARRQLQHTRLVKQLDPWAGGDKPLADEMTRAPQPHRLPAPPPLPAWVQDDVARFGDS
ncbi:hypothetical protein [Mesorhizobium sp.]|uniref:hypothetical protein n=1 Tax=Mesorhizobium sp. TaxID=1871066 RepID=UPI001206416E|nr:hypothetical protein [Mesorhizobium sp.]TIQ46736.1 MAG: hypothetical protein E5X47_23365 [Mesorhizobium sp.]TIQ56509.1 MAG: hypothetical protein E5X46_18730 [Mesorhizobium sp.]